MKVDDVRAMLKRWIEERSSQARIAEAMETSAANVSRWLGGRMGMDLGTLDRMLEAAGTDVLTLVSMYGEGKIELQPVPILSLRSIPPMTKDFETLLGEVATLTRDRTGIPVRDPAMAVRVPYDVGDLRAGEVAAVIAPDGIESGKVALVQLQGRSEFGVWQQARAGGQVVVNGHVYEPGEFVMVGRSRGAWRDT